MLANHANMTSSGDNFLTPFLLLFLILTAPATNSSSTTTNAAAPGLRVFIEETSLPKHYHPLRAS